MNENAEDDLSDAGTDEAVSEGIAVSEQTLGVGTEVTMHVDVTVELLDHPQGDARDAFDHVGEASVEGAAFFAWLADIGQVPARRADRTYPWGTSSRSVRHPVGSRAAQDCHAPKLTWCGIATANRTVTFRRLVGDHPIVPTESMRHAGPGRIAAIRYLAPTATKDSTS